MGVFRKPTDSKQDALDQLTVGFGGGASGFVEAGAFSSMNLVAGWLGGLAVAGWAVVLNMTALIFMIPLGLSAATASLASAPPRKNSQTPAHASQMLAVSQRFFLGRFTRLLPLPSAGTSD